MAEEPKNNLRNQLLEVAESIVKVADTMISPQKDRKFDDVAVPQKFFCPLSNVLMTDPVMLSNGHTFDRLAIEKWLKESGKMICPKTKEALSDSNVSPNHIARVLIREWCKKTQ